MAKSPKSSATKKPAATDRTRKPAKQKTAAIKLATAPTPELDAPEASVLDRLFETVTSRKGADPSISHSARLLSRGTHKIAQKFGEEAVECLIEAVAGNPRELIGESADVLYHLVVMWVNAGINPSDVWSELMRREGTSGIAEKASRPKKPLG